MKAMKSQQSMGAYFDALRKAAKISAPGFPELLPEENVAPAKADCKDACKDGKCAVKPAAKCKDECKDNGCKKNACKDCKCEPKPAAK